LIIGLATAELDQNGREDASKDEENQGHWVNPDTHVEPYPRKSGPTPRLPENFTWTNVGGVNYINNVWNQHIP
jgi:hypothetical protein